MVSPKKKKHSGFYHTDPSPELGTPGPGPSHTPYSSNDWSAGAMRAAIALLPPGSAPADARGSRAAAAAAPVAYGNDGANGGRPPGAAMAIPPLATAAPRDGGGPYGHGTSAERPAAGCCPPASGGSLPRERPRTWRRGTGPEFGGGTGPALPLAAVPERPSRGTLPAAGAAPTCRGSSPPGALKSSLAGDAARSRGGIGGRRCPSRSKPRRGQHPPSETGADGRRLSRRRPRKHPPGEGSPRRAGLHGEGAAGGSGRRLPALPPRPERRLRRAPERGGREEGEGRGGGRAGGGQGKAGRPRRVPAAAIRPPPRCRRAEASPGRGGPPSAPGPPLPRQPRRH